ncbi:Lrp/AsnC family transcriptional regulator [Pseudarthrobacter sp902506025]|uniref:DNA-binding Lrp family transcriptional regulator n=1 Tax=Pseudarthrobacter defluvii TaxID=410837 RepID=A0ABT9UFG6_9MICC|nr:Lrp/AsnC family transcriptional regulator [Pseudarthrobacter defluvii]MDQ0118387.1 DNA-binding Lrp family transcriptional regulator [Pseudarthrobacter defluvii]
MDELDEQILQELLANGRITVTELADKVGLTRISASRRMTTLLTESGVRVIGLAHPAVVGLPVMAHVSIDAATPVQGLAERIAQDHRVLFVSITAGIMSLIAEVRAQNHEELQACIEDIRNIPGVTHMRTSIYTDLLIDILHPAQIKDLVLDKLDLALIEILRQDGRTSYTTMATVLGISTGTARTRVLRLLDSGIVKIGLTWRPASQERVTRMGLGLRIQGTAAELVKSLEAIPGFTFLASSIGQHDIIATVHGTDASSALRTVDQVRAIPEVIHVETWIHLKVVKEEH